HCVNHVAVTGLDPGGTTTVVHLRDALAGASCRVSARVVVNAAGPWVDAVRALAGATGGRRLHLTKGIHLVVPHARLPIRHAVVMQTRDRRSAFAVPRDGASYVGTTDTDHGPPVDHPAVTADDAEYLLDAANRCFAGSPVTVSDVTGTWAGLRPLLHEDGKRPSEISRKDEIMVDAGTGLISIAGGKLTTYRRMAERVVDLVCKRLGHRAACRSEEVPLPGGERSPEDVARRLPALPAGTAERLVRLHGADAEAIVARGVDNVPGLPGALRAEIAHVLDTEMARATGPARGRPCVRRPAAERRGGGDGGAHRAAARGGRRAVRRRIGRCRRRDAARPGARHRPVGHERASRGARHRLVRSGAGRPPRRRVRGGGAGA